MKSYSSYTISIALTIMFGIPLSLIWNFLPQLFPFAITWIFVHPLYKIWKEMDRK